MLTTESQEQECGQGLMKVENEVLKDAWFMAEKKYREVWLKISRRIKQY